MNVDYSVSWRQQLSQNPLIVSLIASAARRIGEPCRVRIIEGLGIEVVAEWAGVSSVVKLTDSERETLQDVVGRLFAVMVAAAERDGTPAGGRILAATI